MTRLTRRLEKAAAAACLAAAVTASGCSSSESSTPLDDDAGSRIEARLQSVLDTAVGDGMPGIALSVRGERLSFDGVSGVEDLATAVPLTTSHRFYLASVGKTYLAVATAALAADGVLGLDDPITDWLPEAVSARIPSSESISVRQLLNHTSGLFDFQNDGEAWDRAFLDAPGRRWRNEDALPFFLDRPLHFAPSTDYRYSNSNYVLAALVVEQAAGLPIDVVLRQRVIEPLGLGDTFHGNEAVGIARFVHGYVFLDDTLTDVHPWYRAYGISDAGVQASAADLADFVHGLMTSDAVLEDSMRAELLTPSGVGEPPSDYALGLNVVAGDTPDYFVYGHGGKDPGSQAEYVHVAAGDTHVTIALCASASFDGYDALFQSALQEVIAVLGDAG